MILVGRFQSVIFCSIKRERRHFSDMKRCRCGVMGYSSGTVLRAEAPSTRSPWTAQLLGTDPLATENTNNSAFSFTAIALWLGMISVSNYGKNKSGKCQQMSLYPATPKKSLHTITVKRLRGSNTVSIQGPLDKD